MSRFSFSARKFKRLLRKPKFLKARKKILEFQKFSAIWFIATSGTSGISQPGTDDLEKLAKLFRALTSLAYQSLRRWLSWVVLWSSKFFTFVTALWSGVWPYLSPYFGFLIFASLALLIFRRKVSRTSQELRNWIEKRWPRYGCSMIVFLLFLLIYSLVIVVTDIPPLPVRRMVRYSIFKMAGLFRDSSELSLKEPVPITPITGTGGGKSSGQAGTLIFLSVLSVLFLRYLLSQFHRQVLKDLPFGEFLIELYEHDMENAINSPS
jgi:hypothetical protein